MLKLQFNQRKQSISAHAGASFTKQALSTAEYDEPITSVGLIVSAVLTVVAPFLADISYEVLVGSRMIIGMAEVLLLAV